MTQRVVEKPCTKKGLPCFWRLTSNNKKQNINIWFWNIFENYVTSKIAFDLGFGIRYSHYVRQFVWALEIYGINLQLHYVQKLRQKYLRI